jgi:hypothetical protein
VENRKNQTSGKRIAQILDAERSSADLSTIQASLDAINARLEKLEANQNIPQSAVQTPQFAHPSLDKFAIAEAIADQIFAAKGNEKACTFEPSKPCDHCSMCSSRGF